MAKLRIKNGFVEDYTIILCTRDYRFLGQLTNVRGVTHRGNLNSANEMSFTVYKSELPIIDNGWLKIKLQNYRQFVWDNIIDLKLIYVKELEEYFEIKISTEDSNETYKNITATSLCEAELSQKNIYGFECNTDGDTQWSEGGIRTKFYDVDNKKASFMHRIMNIIPAYTLKHVDSSLNELIKEFSVDQTSVYDFLVGEVSEKFECLFQFDTKERGIYVYDLCNTCNTCDYRGDFVDVCPKCGSTVLKYKGFGENTTIYVDKDNLTDGITFETDIDSVKNCFKLVSGDETMDAAIRELNQNGTDKIQIVTDYMRNDMPASVLEKIDNYNVLYASKTDEYKNIISEIYSINDDIRVIESLKMPDVSESPINATTEKNKLTTSALSPIGMQSLNASISVDTVNRAVLNYAKVIVKSGYVKLEIVDGSFTFSGTNETTGISSGNWTGKIKVTNYSDDTDVATTANLTLTINTNYEKYIKQKILKKVNTSEDKEGSVLDVLNTPYDTPYVVKNDTAFRTNIEKYSLNRVESFRDALQEGLTVLTEMGADGDTEKSRTDEQKALYQTMFVPYKARMQMCDSVMTAYENEINSLKEEKIDLEQRKTEIQNLLNFENYLGDDYKIFCSYIREDVYNNSNYFSDGLSNNELLNRAEEFLEEAKKELEKSGTRQHSLSSTLKNLLIMKEFKSLTEHFELGNWIQVRVDGVLYKLRLIGYAINFDDLSSLEVEFSTVTKVKDISNKISDILDSAQSMATSYGSFTKQVDIAGRANGQIRNWIDDGLNSALVTIKSNAHEEFKIDQFGILGRSYDDITESYDPRQLIINHNIIALTKNNWESASLALGEHNYTHYDQTNKKWVTERDYGFTAEFVQAGHVIGSEIIGGDIYSDNYEEGKQGTHINLRNGNFDFAGGKLSYDGTTLALDGNVTANEGTIGSWTVDKKKLYASYTYDVKDADGNVIETKTVYTLLRGHDNNLGVAIAIGSPEASDATNAKIKLWKDGRATFTGKVTASDLHISGGEINIQNSDGSTSFDVDSNGLLHARNAIIEGKILAGSGTIGGWNIGTYSIWGEYVENETSYYTSIRNRENYEVAIGIGSSSSTTNADAKIKLYHNGNADFSGKVTASNIIATGGVIGEWTIDSNSNDILYSGEDGYGYACFRGGTRQIAIALGSATPTGYDDAKIKLWKNGLGQFSNIQITGGTLNINDRFIVDKNGNVTATSIDLGNTLNGFAKTSDLDEYAKTSDVATYYISKDGIISRQSSDGATSFTLSKTGLLTAKNAVIEGKILAGSGTIGGWNIGTYSIWGKRTQDDKDYYTIIRNNPGDSYKVAIGIGSDQEGNTSNAKIKLYHNGDADFTGKVTASDMNITGGKITLGGITISSNGTTLTASKTDVGDVSLSTYVGNIAANKITANYIDSKIGDIDDLYVNNVYVRDGYGLYFYLDDKDPETGVVVSRYINVFEYIKALYNQISKLSSEVATLKSYH